MKIRTFLAAASTAFLLLAACDTVPQPVMPYPLDPSAPLSGPPSSCAIISSSDWGAWIDAMPGPDAQARLVVSGRVTVPTGGYRPSLRIEQVAESYPVQVSVRLDPNPPSGGATQAVVRHEVRGVWPMQAPVGSVTVRCGAQALAHISPVETAH